MSRQVVVLNIWISLQLDRLTERRKTVAEHEAKIHSLIFHTLDKQTAAKIEQNTKLQVKSQPPFHTDILINETNVQITHLFTHCFLCRCWSESIKRFWPPTSSSGWSRLRNGTSWTSSWTTGWKGKKKTISSQSLTNNIVCFQQRLFCISVCRQRRRKASPQHTPLSRVRKASICPKSTSKVFSTMNASRRQSSESHTAVLTMFGFFYLAFSNSSTLCFAPVLIDTRQITLADTRTFEDMWLTVDAEVKQLVEKALDIDSLICKQHYGIAWQRPQLPVRGVHSDKHFHRSGHLQFSGLSQTNPASHRSRGMKTETDTESTDVEVCKDRSVVQSDGQAELVEEEENMFSMEMLTKVMEPLWEEIVRDT